MGRKREVEEGSSIPVDTLFEEGTVILIGDPLPDKTPEEMWVIAKTFQTTQELVDAYAGTHNKFWWVEDNVYDFEEGTEEHRQARAVTDKWGELYDHFVKQVILRAEKEGLLDERKEGSGLVKQLERFMKKYGYRDGRGWWVKN